MDSKRNSSILDDFPKVSIHMIEQLMQLYRAGGNYWKDGLYKNEDKNPEIWPILQGEAIRTILMLCRSFPEAREKVLANAEYREVVRRTLDRLVQKVVSGQYEATPYIDFSPIDTDPNQPLVFIESLYTAGAVFLYALLVFGDEKRIVEDKDQIATQLQVIVNRLKRAYIKEKDKKTAAWGFCDLNFRSNFYDFDEGHHYELLYFTYNTINFITLLNDSNAGRFITETSLRAITGEYFAEIRGWLENDFLNHSSIDMLKKPINLQIHDPKFNDTEKYRIYNNFYVVISLLLLESEQTDKLEPAVKFAAKYVIDRYDSNFSFGSLSYPAYKFPLTGRQYDEADNELREKCLEFDDRSIHTLVLLALCLLAQQKGESGGIDQELMDMIAVSYEELLKIRSTEREFSDLWDCISKPSIYYTVRAVDAITELYSLAKNYGDIPIVSSEQHSEAPAVAQSDLRKIVREEMRLYFKGLLESFISDGTGHHVGSADTLDVDHLVDKKIVEAFDGAKLDSETKLGKAEEKLNKSIKKLDDKIEKLQNSIKPVIAAHREAALGKGKQ